MYDLPWRKVIWVIAGFGLMLAAASCGMGYWAHG